MRPIIGITADIEGNHLKLNRDYAEAVDKAGAFPVLLAPSRNAADIALRIDGILVSGGSDLHPSYYNEDINYEIYFLHPHKRLIKKKLLKGTEAALNLQ